MIKYADNSLAPQVRNMWKTVFDDPDAYMDVYFRDKYRNENTLVYIENDKAVASLQMLPYMFTFCGKEIPAAYLSGACTLPQYRGKGYMSALLKRSFREMKKRNIPLALLVPQESALLKFYAPFGFAQAFDAGTEELPSLKELLARHPHDLYGAYCEFDGWFRQKDMTVQKSFDDFCSIVEEAALFDFPPKQNRMGMARIIDAETLLAIFAQRYRDRIFSLSVIDSVLPENEDTFVVQGGECKRQRTAYEPHFHVGIDELVQLLLGYRTAQKDEPLRTLFPEKKPQMNFMLE
ncbi:MAG: GNAT family N-acetyltransferase [Dysgonamonadaceae bacterium]|jgi:predicted acetyltransferase|nr:GNAT family N-acetyltransferase [Dysgonamonadaceae bacterium]